MCLTTLHVRLITKSIQPEVSKLFSQLLASLLCSLVSIYDPGRGRGRGLMLRTLRRHLGVLRLCATQASCGMKEFRSQKVHFGYPFWSQHESRRNSTRGEMSDLRSEMLLRSKTFFSSLSLEQS